MPLHYGKGNQVTDAIAPRDAVDLTRDLVQIRSINPPGDELPVAERLAGAMRAFGLTIELDLLAPNRANLIGRLPGSGAGHLVFTGHLDVVPPGEQPWNHEPFGADLLDGRLYGRGGADMKGGVAAMAVALGILKQQGFKPSADVILAATAGEEAGMLGASAMVERRSLDGAAYLVVGEPTDLDVFIAEKGVLWVTVRALGRTAHGSMPELGSNAIQAISGLVEQLEPYPFDFRESASLGKPTLSPNVIRGGNKTNVVPDVCEISLDLRTVPGQDHQAILSEIRRLAGEAAEKFGARIEIEIENDKAPLETDPEERLVGDTVSSVEQVCGRKPHVGGVSYGTDAACLGPGFNIPMVICGPGSQAMAHQPDEYVETLQIIQATEIYADLARRLLGDGV
ncbi:MAG: M20 family metallopeptidase [Chloroflexota bacterium]